MFAFRWGSLDKPFTAYGGNSRWHVSWWTRAGGWAFSLKLWWFAFECDRGQYVFPVHRVVFAAGSGARMIVNWKPAHELKYEPPQW